MGVASPAGLSLRTSPPHGVYQGDEDPLYIGVFLTLFLSQWEFLKWEIWVSFPKESQLQQSHYPTLINYKAHAGSFRVSIIHWTPTWAAGALFNVRKWSIILCMCRRVRAHTNSESAHFWLGKTLTNLFVCSWCRWGSNLWSLDLESDALPTEPPSHSTRALGGSPATQLACSMTSRWCRFLGGGWLSLFHPIHQGSQWQKAKIPEN